MNCVLVAAATKLAAVQPLLDRGWQLVLCQGKKPVGAGWQNRPQTAESLATAFEIDPTLNVGVVLGARSGLIDVECDSDEAAENLAKMFGGEIPQTPSYTSRRGCHYLFVLHARLEALGA